MCKTLVGWIVVSFIAFLNPILVIGQTSDNGIKFESGLSWEQVKAKAKAENKSIFMDCFATWCGPCKTMDKEVYPQKEVGDYFNAHFISVKVQMDQTLQDAPNVKAWYTNASELGKIYKISAYPSFLFFSPDGIAVHYTAGARNAGDFIAKAAEAFDPDKQYYTMMDHWKAHLTDSAFLTNALTAALKLFDDQNVKVIAEAYINNLKAPLARENLRLISYTTHSSSDKGFLLFVNNEQKIGEVMGDPNYSSNVIGPIIYKEDIKPQITKGSAKNHWKEIEVDIQRKYPMLDVWKEPSTDSAFLAFTLRSAKNAKDETSLQLIGEAYLAKVKDLFAEGNIEIICYDMVKSTQDKWFKFLLNNSLKIDQVLGRNNYIESRLIRMVWNEEVVPLYSISNKPIEHKKLLAYLKNKYPFLKIPLNNFYKEQFEGSIYAKVDLLVKQSSNNINWDKIKQELIIKFPDYDIKLSLFQYEAKYDTDHGLWTALENTAFALFKQYGSDLSDSDLNEYSWAIFLHGTNREILLEALKWMKISVDRAPHSATLDTYANLLYKLGQIQEALIWENKAVVGAQQSKNEDEEKAFQINLTKMQKGEKTWN